MRVLGLELVPWSTPWRRHLEALCVFQFTLSFLVLPVACLALFLYLLLATSWYPLPLAYLAWLVYDRNSPNKGGHRIEWLRKTCMWKNYAKYFPITLVKTVELDPSKNYIFCAHPHGILCYGHWNNFSTEGTGFSKIFPGLRSSLLILSGQFFFPFYRDYVMTKGTGAATEASIEWLLTRDGPGRVVVLIVGGALEALEAVPGRFVLRLKNKFGFAKMALKYGTPLVPVFSFGENDVYTQVIGEEGSWLRRLQEFLTRCLGFSPPIFYGRGIFNYNFGLVPYRTPINTVVGGPIPVERVEQPSRQEVAALHKVYVEELIKLFETHKTKYGVPEDQHLTIA